MVKRESGMKEGKGGEGVRGGEINRRGGEVCGGVDAFTGRR
jgi:hypothetical protein